MSISSQHRLNKQNSKVQPTGSEFAPKAVNQIEHIFSGLASIADLAQRMTTEPEGNDLL